MKWVNQRKEKLKQRTKNNRNRQKFIKELRQTEMLYAQHIQERLEVRKA